MCSCAACAVGTVVIRCCLGKVGRALNPTRNAAGGAATPPCSSPFSLQSQPFIPSSWIQRCVSAGIASPSIQLLFLSPRGFQRQRVLTNVQILECCVRGISDLAIKIFDLHLVEYQQGQMEPCFFPKLLPQGILFLRLLLLELAATEYKGKGSGSRSVGLCEGWTPQQGFWGCWEFLRAGWRSSLQHKQP